MSKSTDKRVKVPKNAALDLTHIKQQLRDKVEKELEGQLRSIPRTVQQVVESAILSIIGVEKRNGGYKVDTWGGSNKKQLNDYIERKVDQTLKNVVGPIVEKEFKRVLKLITLKRDIARTCTSQMQYAFERKFKEKIGKRMEELGEKFGNQVADELDEALKDTATFNDDLLDPASFQGRIGELFLEEAAEIAAGPDAGVEK